MRILCDKPAALKEVLGEGYHVDYSPALDIYTKSNALFKTLRGLYVSSKLDFDEPEIIDYIKECAKPLTTVPTCHTCYTYEQFDEFCKTYLDNESELRVAYDVETTAAPFLSKRYKLAGFSLANTVEDGCYVVLDSIDYHNPDKDKCLERLSQVIKSHNMLVFNSQHEYIATKICLKTNLMLDSKHLDDAYAYALTLKTEAFKQDVFKLKLLCHRLLGTDNWASIIDDYVELAQEIGADGTYNFDELTDKQECSFDAFCAMLEEYDYSKQDCIKFVKILQKTYPVWENYGTLPYTMIPCRMIERYGCYDACYLVALFDYFENWAEELDEKLAHALNKPDTKKAYEECVASQIMSAILTINGITISDERDEEVRAKSIDESDKYYNRLWDVKSDVTGDSILREFVIHDEKQRIEMEKKYLLPKHLIELIPDGFEFVSTTPSFYSFTVNKKTDDLDAWIAAEGLKPISAKQPDTYKILQKHLKPFSALDDEDALLYEVLDEYMADMVKKKGSLSKSVFTPMSSPDALFQIITRELNYSHFLSRVILYEYQKLADKDKDLLTDKFLEEHLLYDFDSDVELYVSTAKKIRDKVMKSLSKSRPYQNTYDNLVKEGIKSFSSPIISYIYDVYTATGCTFDEPRYAGFDFICRLKTCRKYLRIFSTFVAGSSGGYAVQKYVYKDSINNDHLTVSDAPVTNKDKQLLPPLEDEKDNVERFAFGSWYANTAETGRWQATVHNVPAGPFCKRRFVSRYPGGFILANDMSQAEVRELAAVSKCKGLLETVKDPTVDIHKRTASLAFNVPYDEVTSTQRKLTKGGIFSIVYGRNEQSLAQELFKGDHAAAKRLMDAIFTVYPEIPVYLKDAFDDVMKTGYLVTRRGAPIFVNPYTQDNADKGIEGVRRLCQNYSIQGGAAGFCTGTLVNVQKLLNKHNLRSKIMCYIHDAVYLDCPPDEFDDAFVILNSAFNKIATDMFKVPTASDTEFGVSMGSGNEITRLDKWHYKIEGNYEDVLQALEQFKLSYNVEIIKDKLGEVEYHEDDVSWIFIQRSELSWHSQTQDYEVEIKLTPKL